MSHVPFGNEENAHLDISRRKFLVSTAGLAALAGLPAMAATATAANPSTSQAKGTTEKFKGDTVTTKDGIQIYYKDWGRGQPIVFSHGWPPSAADWGPPTLFFLQQ